MSSSYENINYMNIADNRALNKLNKLYKNNQIHRENLTTLYYLIKDIGPKDNHHGTTHALWVTYNSMKLLLIALEKYPTDITYVYLNGKSRILQAITMLHDVLDDKYTEKIDKKSIDNKRRKITNCLQNLNFTEDEIGIIEEIISFKKIYSENNTIFSEPNREIKKLIHEWVSMADMIECMGLNGTIRCWKCIDDFGSIIYENRNLHSDMDYLDEVIKYYDEKLLKIYTNYISKDFIKDIVKPLHVEMLDFYNEYHSGDEGKLGCIEKIKTLLRAELYLPSLEKILDRY